MRRPPDVAGARAVYNASGLEYYRHSDWLGSSRLASTASRAVYYDGAYAAYGENYAETGTQDRSFTGQDQDIVPSGAYPLYDFLMREYHPTWGRWLSPDPAGLAAANPANPQSWNRYAYVLNNPTNGVDPLGLDSCVPGKGVGHWASCDFTSFGSLGYGGGFDPCYIDGSPVDCGMFGDLAGSGESYVVCPSGGCDDIGVWTGNGWRVEHYVGTIVGSGLYPYFGPGADYYSADEAGAAGALYYEPDATTSDANGYRHEYGGNVYEDSNGVYSYTQFLAIGPACGVNDMCSLEIPVWVPAGTTIEGDYHTHPWDRGSYQFNGDLTNFPAQSYPSYVATPVGSGYSVVKLTAAGPCSLAGVPFPGIPGC